MRSNTTARLLLLTALIVAAAAHAQPAVDEAAVQAELDALTTDVEALEPTYLAAAALERRYQFTARLSDGQLFFLTGDYDRAAMVLLDLVTNPSSQTHPAYRDALYYLAESLYLTRNYKASAGWFDHVAERGDPAQRQHAVARQLEIALRLGDGPAAERALKRARVLLDSTADSTLRYAVGKYHFRTGDLAGAAEHFALIPPGSPDYSRARYFLGVIETAGRHFDAALAHFDAVIASPAVNGEADPTRLARVRDEALLARARIFYEQGRLGDAIGAYNQVPRDSSLFEQAMSESVWISIKEGAYDKALRKLEILLISQPDIRKGHEARLLRGKLLMMLGRHGEAIEAFEEVRREFEPMQQDMRDVTRAHADLEAHFNEVIGANIEEFDLDSFLPEEAAEFAGPDAEADRALQLVGDLAAEQRDVEDARRTLDRLDVAL
ncbi:MAG: tetratricopeptide repeat protein, partial [Myxococcales bacterium]|nr:tetratricopeptide repeat protein [Myxococcales bacterium]